MRTVYETNLCPGFYSKGKHARHTWVGSFTGMTWQCPGNPEPRRIAGVMASISSKENRR